MHSVHSSSHSHHPGSWGFIGLPDDPQLEIAQAHMDRQQIEAERQAELADLAWLNVQTATIGVPCRCQIGKNYKGELISVSITLPDGRGEIDFHPAIVKHVPQPIADRVVAGCSDPAKYGNGEATFTSDELVLLEALYAVVRVRPATVRSSSRRW